MQGKEGFSKHAHLKISWIKHQISQKDGFLNYPPPSSYGVNSNFTKDSSLSSSSGLKISPALLFIIVILSILFFVSGVLHLLVRFLTKCPSHSQSNRNNLGDSSDPNDALQRQLQQLFHLTDSGLDQAFIDLLPLFSYKEILGPKEPFDCAVCLCEFSQTDRLRLLPACSHAFHKNCIDTWLLSNSTCPICRRTLLDSLNEYPVFGYDGIKEEENEEEEEEDEKNLEIEEVSPKKGVFQVRLGKFRKLNDAEWKEEDGSSSSRIDERRCYSMGSYQYVVGDSDLRVALRRDGAGGDSSFDGGSAEGKKICNGAKIDSYSVSKIWLWSKKGKFATSCEDQSENIQSSPNLDLTWMHRTQGI